jgi:phospholipase C
VLHSALRSDLALSPPEQKPRILAQFSALNTREQACQYVNHVRRKVAVAKGGR